MPNYTEEALLQAVQAYREGMPRRKAAQRWGIPLTTLGNRIRGSKPRTIIAESRQRLTKKQERDLAGWIIIQGSIGTPPSHRQVAKIASSLLPSTPSTQPLGKYWIEGFIRRNPEVKALRGKRIDLLRVNGADECTGIGPQDDGPITDPGLPEGPLDVGDGP